MKTYAHILSVVICIVLAAAAANADITVYSGAIYDVVITDPVPVGANPGGEALLGFTLMIVNTSGDPSRNPAAFSGTTPKETRPNDTDTSIWFGMQAYTGFTSGPTTVTYVPVSDPDPRAPGYYDVVVAGDPGFHNQFIGPSTYASPTIDDPDFATDVDTHFLVTTTTTITPSTGPREDFNLGTPWPWLSTNEPSNVPFSNPFKIFEANDFGNRLFGQFALKGGAAADIDGDGDPTVWQIAYFAVKADTTIYMNFQVGSISFGPSPVVEGNFTVVPEPATMSLLAWGCLAVLPARRRGRRRRLGPRK